MMSSGGGGGGGCGGCGGGDGGVYSTPLARVNGCV